jgi:pyridoxamine 5'-phosphate oxidase
VREWLRSLTSFPRELPEFDVVQTPAEPAPLFLDWLREAVDAGVLAAHAAVLSTAASDAGVVRSSARTLILKDVDAVGWQFATGSNSAKGRAIAQNASVALTFFWPALGRQVRISGDATRQPDAVGRQDFLDRPAASRAAALVGRQSEPLSGPDEYRTALEGAEARVDADPGLVAEDWSVYAIAPAEVEFWQATHDRAHRRLLYRAVPGGWTKTQLWP